MRRFSQSLIATIVAAAFVFMPTPSLAANPAIGTATNYTTAGFPQPAYTALGPDGNIWATSYGSDEIWKVSPSGNYTHYTNAAFDFLMDIAAGPDGNMWVADYGDDAIWRITTSGTMTHFTDASIDHPQGITVGPDDALWFTNRNNGSIGRITTSGVVTNFADGSLNAPQAITVGPDGNFWIANNFGHNIVKMSADGSTFTAYNDAGIDDPNEIISALGSLWFSSPGNDSLGRIETDGTIEMYTDALLNQPWGIALGPDKKIWFASRSSNGIVRRNNDGTFTNFTDPSGSGPTDLSVGADGGIWVANQNNSLSRVAALTTPGVPTAVALEHSSKTSVMISGNIPANLGGGTTLTTEYLAQCVPVGGGTIKSSSATGSPPIFITGLDPDVSYDCRIRTQNAGYSIYHSAWVAVGSINVVSADEDPAQNTTPIAATGVDSQTIAAVGLIVMLSGAALLIISSRRPRGRHFS